MTRFVVGDDRSQSSLFPERLDDYLAEDNPVRAIDVFVDEFAIDLRPSLEAMAQSLPRLSLLGIRFSMLNFNSAAERYTPWTNLP